MAAAEVQQKNISWLDNSFASTSVKPVDKPHSVKRSHCSSFQNAKRKTAKVKCITEKDCINNLTVDVKPKDKMFTNVKGKNGPSDDLNRDLKEIQQHYSSCDSPSCLAVDEDDEVSLYSSKDKSTALLVFTDCHVYSVTIG